MAIAEIQPEKIDGLVREAVFGEPGLQLAARRKIWDLGQAAGVLPASVHDLYLARGGGSAADLRCPPST